jgi:hypothetical protein
MIRPLESVSVRAFLCLTALTGTMVAGCGPGEAEVGTRIRFSQIGWQEGQDWYAGFAYFDEAWDYVLQAMKQHLEGDPGSGPMTRGGWYSVRPGSGQLILEGSRNER